jgi:hypothetical protein
MEGLSFGAFRFGPSGRSGRSRTSFPSQIPDGDCARLDLSRRAAWPPPAPRCHQSRSKCREIGLAGSDSAGRPTR